MEVVHIVLGKANPNRMNGVNKVVFQLASKQAESGRKVSIWGFSKNTEVNYDERPFETKIFQAYKNGFKIDPNFKEMVKKQSKETIFHLHGGWIPTFYSISRILSKLNRTYVTTPHGAYNEIAMKKSAFTKKIYFQLFEKYVLRNAKYIHCIGQSEVVGLNTIYKTDKTKLLPYGYESESVAVKEKENSKLIFGFLGRLDIHTKGLDLMIEAFAKSFKGNEKVELWIIGDSDQRSKLESLVQESQISDQVTFWGAKFNEEKIDLLQKIDVFLHPSRNEGLPTAVLEAAAFGIPCIVTQATNVGEYIDKFQAGLSIPDNNSDHLAEAMLTFSKYEEKEFKNKSKNALKMLKKEFSWANVVNNFDQLYLAS